MIDDAPRNPKAFSMPTVDFPLFNTVRLETWEQSSNGRGGTGFFFEPHWEDDKLFPFIVTNSHVMKKADILKIHFHMADPNSEHIHPYNSIPNNISSPQLHAFYSANPELDLCAIYLGGHLMSLGEWFGEMQRPVVASLSPENILDDEELQRLAYSIDLDIVGYPDLIWDETYNLPIYRRGYSATHVGIDFNHKPFFLANVIDTPGSSGSPVYALMSNQFLQGSNIEPYQHRHYLMGILTSGISYFEPVMLSPSRRVTEPNMYSPVSLNLAQVHRAKYLLDFFEEVRIEFPHRMKILDELLKNEANGIE